jgi:hypothetical protein
MNDWQKEQKEKTQANTKLAKQLAPLLGAQPGKACARDFCVELDLDTGMGFNVQTDDRDKFVVRCHWPLIDHRYYRPEDSNSIRVTKSRGIEALAKEITRRLLPGYPEAFQAQLDRGNNELDTEEKMRQLVVEFSRLANNKSAPSEQELQGHVLHTYKHNLYQIQINSLDSVTIRTSSVPVAVAKKIVALMVELNKE